MVDGKEGNTLSMVDAGRDAVASTLDNEPTDVSPVLAGSTAANAALYIDGSVASATAHFVRYFVHSEVNVPITELKVEDAGGMGVGDGLGAALQGSRPSYTELESGFSSTKLPPKPFADVEPPYR